MKINELKKLLIQNKDKFINFLIDEHKIPNHFHVTEVGRENKEFIDCGGKKRKIERCILQVWVGKDTDHRLKANKLVEIIELGEELFVHDYPEVYIEYEKTDTSQYPIIDYKEDKESISIFLGKKHTECLAPEKCGNLCNKQTLYTLK